MNPMLIAIIVILIAFLIYKWGTKDYDYFKKKGIPFPKPLFLIGNSGGSIMRKYSMPEYFLSLYKEFSEHK